MSKTIQIGSGAKSVPTSTTNSSGVSVSRTSSTTPAKKGCGCGRK